MGLPDRSRVLRRCGDVRHRECVRRGSPNVDARYGDLVGWCGGLFLDTAICAEVETGLAFGFVAPQSLEQRFRGWRGNGRIGLGNDAWGRNEPDLMGTAARGANASRAAVPIFN